MDDETLKYRIALSFLNNIGPLLARTLVSYCGGVEQVFSFVQNKFLKIPGIGPGIVNSLNREEALSRAEREIKFVRKNNIKVLFYLDDEYPLRLKQCADSPILLYTKGNQNLNPTRTISIVGTRKATDYGKKVVRQMLNALIPYDVLIVSGLAYGIDYNAHNEAVKNSLQTVGVLGHGLDRIYPAAHNNLARKMMKNGGILSEYPFGTMPDRENFPQRNRIIAGLSDAVIVVESNVKGGAIITAIIANSYNRDVFAVPGDIDREYSSGCNQLIQQSRAAIFTSVSQMAENMGWNDKPKKTKVRQPVLPLELSDDEKIIMNLLPEKISMAIDNIILASPINSSRVSSALLELEFKGLVIPLPGKHYKLS